MSRVLIGLTASALVMSACASDSSPSSDTASNEQLSSDSSAPRQRNTMVGGFGTDKSGFVDVPLVGATRSRKGLLTLHRNADGTNNIAFHERGQREGAPFNTLVQARLTGNGVFDTTFGQGGFAKFEIGEKSLSKILFDSQGNLLLWLQKFEEIPNSGSSESGNNWKESNEIRAYNFGDSTPNSNYGTAGVISLDEIAPAGVSDVVVGMRGTSADGLTLLRYSAEDVQVVSLTAKGEIDSSVVNGGVNLLPEGQHDRWASRLVDTSLVERGDDIVTSALAGEYRAPEPTDCVPNEYCVGPVLGFDYVINNAHQPTMKGSTTEIDDLLDAGEGEISEIFAASWGISSKGMVSTQSARMKNEVYPPELIVTTNNYSANSTSRGVFNTETGQWNAVTHFSFFDNVDETTISVGNPKVAPTGNALVAFFSDHSKEVNGLMACNPTFGMCDVATSSTIVYAKAVGGWPRVSDVNFDTEGKIHALVSELTVAGAETDAVIEMASDGALASSQVEQIPATLRNDPAVSGNGWTADVSSEPTLGSKNTIYVNGSVLAAPPSQGSVPAVATLSKTQSGRSVSQEGSVAPFVDGFNIDWESNLKFDAAGNDYVNAWKNGAFGLVRLLAGTRAIDTTYGVGGFAQVDNAPNDQGTCSWMDYDVAESGQIVVVRMTSKLDGRDECDENRHVTAAVAITNAGVVEPLANLDASLATLNIRWGDKVIVSPLTKEFYVVTESWLPDDMQGEIHQVSIRRFGPTGALDRSFGVSGVLSYDSNSPLDTAQPMAVDNEGQLVLVELSDDGSVVSLRLARLKRDGTLDAAVDAPAPPAPNPGELRTMRDEQEQTSNPPAPQQQASSVVISGTKALGDGNIEVTWISNSVTTNRTFTVTASPGGKTCVSTTNSCVVKGLDAWEKYTFTVAQSGETAQSSASSEAQPVRMVKVGSRVSVKKLLTPASKGAAKYAVSGGCKLSKSTTLIAPKKAGTCLLSVKTAKVGKTAATTRSVRIQIVTALPK